VGQTKEARAGPTGTGNVARDCAKRAVDPSAVAEAVLLYHHSMGAAVPLAYQTRACSDPLGVPLGYHRARVSRLGQRGEFAASRFAESSMAKLLNPVRDGANE